MTPFIAAAVVVAVGAGIYFLAARNQVTQVAYFPVTGTETVREQPSGASQQASVLRTGAPVVSTRGADFISQSTAVLKGEVTPNGGQTSYWYEYGIRESLGSATGRQLLGSGYVTYSAPAGIFGLASNTTYFYRINAENQFGKTYGQIVSFKTTNEPPVQYTAPNVQTKAVTNVSQNSATINGVVNPNGARTDYWFEFGTTLSLGNTTSPLNAGLGRANVSVSNSISGLEQNTTYYYRVNAQNGYGTANGNILSFTTDSTTPPPPRGDDPTAETESATAITSNSATLRGTVDPNSAPTMYYFEYGKATLLGLFSLNQKTAARSAGDGTSAMPVSTIVGNLETDSTYYYRLVAENQNGASRGAIFSLTTKR